jgi:N-acetylneuraminic acid mutarotase
MLKDDIMQKRIFITTALLLLFSGLSNGQDTWTQKANFPTNFLVGTFSFSIGDKGYVGGGYDTLGNYTSDFWEYDPLTDLWTQKANFGGGQRAFATAVSIQGKGYVGLGEDYSSTQLKNDWWEYDPVGDSWTQKADFAGGYRFYPVSFSAINFGYICSGYGFADTVTFSYQTYNDLWEYNPTLDSWSQKTSLPGQVRLDAFAFSIGNKGYVGGGYNDSIPAEQLDFYEFDPILNSWTQKANIPDSARVDAASFSLGNFGYVGIGENELTTSGVANDFWKYNPITDQWIQKTNFPGAERDEGAFFSIGNKGYIGLGGQNSNPTYNDFYEYAPDSITIISELTNSNFSADIFPNPFSSVTTFKTNDNLTNATLTIYNPLGQEIRNIKNISSQTIILQRDNLQSGIYFIRLTQDSKLISTDKLIITD